MFVVLTLIVLLLALIYFSGQKRYKYWNERGYITAPTTFPFGNLKGIGTEVNAAIGLDKIYQSFKEKAKAVGIYFFLTPTLLVMDVELLKHIFIKDFASFHDRGIYYNKEDDPLSANLLTLEGQEWRDRRVKLSPIFTSGKMKMMFEMVDAIGDKFSQAVDKEMKISSSVGMRTLLAKFSTDVISNVAFGLDSNCKFYLENCRSYQSNLFLLFN